MSKQWQLRRGTTAENDEFTGAQGELTMDTDTNALRIHDGVTQGGHMIDCVVAWQVPTAENNYTWYRKYSSGWVEQGGVASTDGSSGTTVNLPIAMSDANYTIQATGDNTPGGNVFQTVGWYSQTTTTFNLFSAGGGNWYASTMYWQVSGMAAV